MREERAYVASSLSLSLSRSFFNFLYDLFIPRNVKYDTAKVITYSIVNVSGISFGVEFNILI